MRDEPGNLPAHVEAVDGVDVQTIEQRHRWLHAGLLVIEGPDAAIDHRGRRRLPEVVADGAEHDGDEARAIEIAVQRPRRVDHHQRVRPDVAFGMPLGLLLAPDERQQLRENPFDDAEIERQAKSDRRPLRLQQEFFNLAPDPLRREIVKRQASAQRRGAFLQCELEPGRELHRAQRAQAVVGERLRIDGAQQAPIEILASRERIFVLAGQRVPRDRVDREVAPARRLDDRHRRIAVDVEALVSAPVLRLPPRQRHVDLARAAAGRRQLVDRKALADRLDTPER